MIFSRAGLAVLSQRAASIGTLLCVLAVLAGRLPAAGPLPQQKRIYIANDAHTDYMWTTDAAGYRQAFLQMLDYYLDLADATDGEALEFQSRFNADGTFWIRDYELNKPAVAFARLIARIKSGHIGVPLTLLNLCYGGMPGEAVLRSMYYAGELERNYGLSLKLAWAQEVQTLPYGLGALWAGAGAKYMAKGICDCASQIPDAWDRPHDMYWWTGPDGSRLLVKWNSMIRRDNYDIGGYAEARNIPELIDYLDTNAGFRARHPYDVIGAFGYAGDDLTSLTDKFVIVAKQMTTPDRQVIVSNQLDFFKDFETRDGGSLPSLGVSFGNGWDLLVASMAELSSRVKRALEKLRGAEAMASLVSLQDAAFMAGRSESRRNAWIGLGMYFEHDWTADGPISRNARAAWQRTQAENFENYVNALHADARARLSRMIRRDGTEPRFYAFNPLGWARTDAADFLYSGSDQVRVIDLATGEETPFQIIDNNGSRYLRVWARDVPAAGYKIFEIRSGVGISFDLPVTAGGSILENALYRVTVGSNGAITGILDKLRGNREMVRMIGGRGMNDLGPGEGTVTFENAGPVSATLKITAALPLAHTTRITLFRDSGRIDIRNEITQNFSQTATWDFGIDVDNPEIRHEEVGAVIKAGLAGSGGSYSDRAARYDWLTLNHFVDCGNGAAGLTLSNADCYFMKLGSSTARVLDAATPLISVLAGGQVDGPSLGIPDQGNDAYFLQRFALQTRDAFDHAAAMRFALEHQNPLVTGGVVGDTPKYPAFSYALLSIDSPQVLLWALKPAEDDALNTLIVRAWNVSMTARNIQIALSDGTIAGAWRTSHIETPGVSLPAAAGNLSLAFNPGQWITCRLEVTGAGENPAIGLSKTSFNFGAEQNGTPTQTGTSVVTNTGAGTLNWTATPSADWISASPGSGAVSGVLTVGIARTDMSPGDYAGTILVAAPNASNSPRTINVGLKILPAGTSGVPFGSFDTPVNGSTVASSIAVTGWVLDDIETTSAKISRNPVGAEPPGSHIFIGDATFVEGARPDIETAYPGYPLKNRAGWGYMLLTNFLPNGGNGAFTLYAAATDKEGHEVVLGSKTITVDNAHAVNPFGAIDTPAQGEEISGPGYFNFGWALTPMPNSIPTNGSTLGVWVDGAWIGRPTYDHYRADVANAFPGYANSNGAVGVFTLDTTTYTNGVHTIAWSVQDNAGNEDGIGSRYFSILNTGTPAPQSSLPVTLSSLSELDEYQDRSLQPIHSRKGYERSNPPEQQYAASTEGVRLNIRELERVEILLDEKAWAADADRRTAERAGLPPTSAAASRNFGKSISRREGYLVVGGELRPLPIGSTLDAAAGIFSWQPGPGFLGDYRLVFIDRDSRSKSFLTIRIEPRFPSPGK